MIEAKIIADSISEAGKRITTMQVKFHRFILSEVNTHRVFSRNFSSSRAIPTKKLLEQVRNDPAMPVHWGKNQAGMQASEELDELTKDAAKGQWRVAAFDAARCAESLSILGAHKQIVNRIIEPYVWANGIVTSTEWENWFELRAHSDAQPEIHELALRMQDAMAASSPRLLKAGEWHLPYITDEEREDSFYQIEANKSSNMLAKISAARCCRVSYLKHDGTKADVNDDLHLFQRLAGAEPKHYSPLEHQATPDEIVPGNSMVMASWKHPELHGNFKGWCQYRRMDEFNVFP